MKLETPKVLYNAKIPPMKSAKELGDLGTYEFCNCRGPVFLLQMAFILIVVN